MNWRINVLNSIDDFDELPLGPDTEASDIRLQVYLARSGVCSRRGAAELLSLGSVRVNGRIIREPGFRVKTNDEVIVDGKKIKLATKSIYVLLNKPVGYVCSNNDPEGRLLAGDLLIPYRDQRLFSVGRLDYMSSGLIIFTNDGNFSNIVSHPRNKIEKEYLVEARKEIPKEFLEEFKKGIYFDGDCYRIQSYRLVSPRVVSLVLTEGKNREIRNAFAARKHTIKSLERVRIGCINNTGLASGRYRALREQEIQWLLGHAQRRPHGRRA
jgi:23S rRNA pseudouridine2605 synthase